MSVLRIWLDQYLDQDLHLGESRLSVLANVYDTGSSAKKPGQPRQIRNEVIPAGYPVPTDTNLWGKIEVPPGRYLVEAVLPSGVNVEEEVNIEKENEEYKVLLTGPRSGHEWLSWQAFQSGPQISRPMGVKDFQKPPMQTKVDAITLPLQSLLTPASLNTPLVSWASMYSLVNTTPHTVEKQLGDVLNKIREPAFGGSVTTVPKGPDDGLTSVRYFAQPGAVSWPYDTRRIDAINYNNGIPRILASISVKEAFHEIASLPVPWAQTDFDGEALIDLSVSDTNLANVRLQTAKQYNPYSELVVRDRLMASIFGYFATGDLQRAAILTNHDYAIDILMEKMHNPFAAAAGAYILLSDVKATGVVKQEKWHDWIKNLMTFFPWMADGAIEYGWLLLREGDYQKAKDNFVIAFQRGLPYYSIGIRWLLDGITVLLDDAKSDGHEDPELEMAFRTVRSVARHTNMAQPFTLVRIGILRERT